MWSFYGIREWRADTKVSTATDSEEDASLFTVRPELVEGPFLLLASVVIVAQSFLISASFFARLQPLIRLSASSASSRYGNSWLQTSATGAYFCEIGRASCRVSVCQSVLISVFSASLKKK